MASRPVLLLGNITSILLTIIAFLQVLSWTIVGLLILATLTIATVVPTGLRSGTAHPEPRRSTNHPSALDTKNHRDRSVEKPSTHTHIASTKLEAKATPKFEPSKTFGSQAKPEPPPKIVPPKVNTVKVNPPIVTPPKSIPNTVSPSKTLPAKSNPPNVPPLRPIPPTLTPTKPYPLKSGQPASMHPSEFRPESNKNPTIAKGDYTSYDIDLDEGVEVIGEVTASGEVNLYILDQDNLNSLDVGEEFWSETGEEAVEKGTLRFTATEKGKWFVIVENADTKDVSVTVNIRKVRSNTAPA